jgi:hypothetical protein
MENHDIQNWQPEMQDLAVSVLGLDTDGVLPIHRVQ